MHIQYTKECPIEEVRKELHVTVKLSQKSDTPSPQVAVPTSGPALFGLSQRESHFIQEDIGTYSSRKVCLLAAGITATQGRKLGPSLSGTA